MGREAGLRQGAGGEVTQTADSGIAAVWVWSPAPGRWQRVISASGSYLEVEKLESLPLLNQTPVLSEGWGMATGNRMGQQGEWNAFSSQPFPLHQEKMNQPVDMGVGLGGGGVEVERKLLPEKEASPALAAIVLPQSSPLFPFPPSLRPLPPRSGGKPDFSWPKLEFTKSLERHSG